MYYTLYSSVGTWFGKGGLSRPEFKIYNSAQHKLEKIRGGGGSSPRSHCGSYTYMLYASIVCNDVLIHLNK